MKRNLVLIAVAFFSLLSLLVLGGIAGFYFSQAEHSLWRGLIFAVLLLFFPIMFLVFGLVRGVR